MSPEERIRRAEEIYYNRRVRNGNVRMPSSQVTENAGRKQYSLYKKMILQILICILIYLIISLVKDANYFFSDGLINKTKEMLSTDINFEVISTAVTDFFQNNKDKFNFLSGWKNNSESGENATNQEKNTAGENGENNTENINGENANAINEEQNGNTLNGEQNGNALNGEQNNNELNNNQNTNTSNTEQNNILNGQNSEVQSGQNNNVTNSDDLKIGIGGGTEEPEVVATSSQSSQKTQMEKDAEYIKANFQMQIPVSGKITSKYGKREPTEIVSENHQGIDIGVVVGTTVVSAMDGKVSVVSDEGGYGTHVKIVNKDITTVYAHCSKILVKEGQTIKKGQKIALSGNTGNTTGPHLHFEIQRSGRTIDPELILKWT